VSGSETGIAFLMLKCVDGDEDSDIRGLTMSGTRNVARVMSKG
jgi:hypothetical protein